MHTQQEGTGPVNEGRLGHALGSQWKKTLVGRKRFLVAEVFFSFVSAFCVFFKQGAGFCQITATEHAFIHSCQLLQPLSGWQICQHPSAKSLYTNTKIPHL